MFVSLIYLIIYVVVVGLVIWLLRFLIDANPLGEPLRRLANIAVVVIGVLVIIVLLLNFVGKHLMAQHTVESSDLNHRMLVRVTL